MDDKAFEKALMAIASPPRFKILAALLDNEYKAGDLERFSEVSQSATSQHLRVLKDMGFVTSYSVQTARYYQINEKWKPAVIELAAIVGLV